MFIASMVIFSVIELTPIDLANKVLGQFATPEQKESWRERNGLNLPPVTRYLDWLVGNDWRLSKLWDPEVITGLEGVINSRTEEIEWWARGRDGDLYQWKMVNGQLIEVRRGQADDCQEEPCWLDKAEKNPADDSIWREDDAGHQIFWGVDTENRAVKWQKDFEVEAQGPTSAGRAKVVETGGVSYRPIQRGLLRGDPGVSFLTGRPVSKILPTRIGNSLILAGIAFVLIMPLALLMGVFAGLNEGKGLDRFISLTSLAATATPEFTIGALLIYFLVIRFDTGFPGAVTLMPGEGLLDHPEMLILPVLTLTMVELGYVIRMTRTSVVEVMNAQYIRTAYLKGISRKRIIFRHLLRNALIAPITVIMLHVNWLVGGIVVVEALFGFPGVGSYLLSAAMFGDVFAIEAGAMFMVILAVSTQMVADIAYTLLNPRIRYS